jgi:hypothetical protein
MRRKSLTSMVLGLLLVLVLFGIWYNIASNYDYGALAGTYVFHGNGEACALHLHADGTFLQELNRQGQVQQFQGHWHRSGEAHVTFSDEFRKISGEEVDAAGETHGEFDKSLGVFPILVLAPLPGGPLFAGRYFRNGLLHKPGSAEEFRSGQGASETPQEV